MSAQAQHASADGCQNPTLRVHVRGPGQCFLTRGVAKQRGRDLLVHAGFWISGRPKSSNMMLDVSQQHVGILLLDFETRSHPPFSTRSTRRSSHCRMSSTCCRSSSAESATAESPCKTPHSKSPTSSPCPNIETSTHIHSLNAAWFRHWYFSPRLMSSRNITILVSRFRSWQPPSTLDSQSGKSSYPKLHVLGIMALKHPRSAELPSPAPNSGKEMPEPCKNDSTAKCNDPSIASVSSDEVL